MKKITMLCIGLALIAIMLAGCVRYYSCPDGTKTLNPSKCAPVVVPEEEPAVEEIILTNPEPVAEEVVPSKEKEMNAETKTLLDKISKVTGVKFIYYQSTDLQAENTYYVSREKMKITLETKSVYSPTDPYDTVYYDFVNKVSSAYCENRESSTCVDRNRKVEVDYDEYLITTPFYWYDYISFANLTGKSKLFDGRTGKEVSFEIDGKTGSMFVDSFYGIPLAVTYNGITYEYRSMAINEVTSKDLEHWTLSNN